MKYDVDLRIVLMAIRYEMLHQKIRFSSTHTHNSDVIIPSIRREFFTMIKENYLLVKAERLVKIPLEIDEGGVAPQTIDILVAYLESIKMRKARYVLFAKPSRIDRYDIPTLELL